MPVRTFTDVVSTDTPTPGGGSVAALSGALGAALAAMVANLTVGKKGYEERAAALGALASKAQEIKRKLLELVDEDAASFDAVIAATRLPKSSEAENRRESKRCRQQTKKQLMCRLKPHSFALKVCNYASKQPKTAIQIL